MCAGQTEVTLFNILENEMRYKNRYIKTKCAETKSSCVSV